jgi:hypothetical protein
MAAAFLGCVMRVLLVLAASCFLLAGCTDADWSRTMSSIGLDDNSSGPEMAAQPSQSTQSPWLDSGAAAQAVRVAPAAGQTAAVPASSPGGITAANDDLCRASASDDADTNAFDAPTRQRVYQLRYAQCQALLAR